MSRSRGDQIVITSLLALVLLVAGMLVMDGWKRSKGSQPAHAPAPATAVEAHDPPAQPQPAAKTQKSEPSKPADNGMYNM